MTTNVGSYDISQLLAARNTTAKQVGMEAVTSALQADLAAHNQIVTEMVSDLCEFSTDALRMWGGNANAAMYEVDEYSEVPAQKNIPGYNVGFPLRLFQFPVNFTRKFLESAPVSEIAQAQIGAEVAHKAMIEKKIRLALFDDGNYDFRDINVDKITLPVKRLLNADGTAIPNGAQGQTFTAGTHTHYRSTGTAAWADFSNLLVDVAEHGHTAGLSLFINRANKDAYVALWNTTNTRFVPLQPVVMQNAMFASTIGVPNQALEVGTIDNKLVGYINDGTEVWIKSWMPANYVMAVARGDARKPLVYRQRNVASLQGLRLASELDMYPLLTKYFEAEFGLGVWERSAASILYTANDTWADVTT